MNSVDLSKKRNIHSQKYVYLEVLHGFNDILCCIDRTYQWCKKNNRKLIMNGKKSIYNVDFYKYFKIPNIILNPTILKDFQGTIYPPELQGKMNDILNGNIVFDIVVNDGFYKGKLLELVNTEADVIVKCCTGGGGGLAMFQQIRFNPILLNIMKERHHRLKQPYLCIHIRNTDYKCDYQKLFYQNEKKIRSFKEIYLCTDDVSTLQFYRQRGIHVKNFTTFPTQYYESLHASTIDPHTKIIDLFCDIYIAGLSNSLLSNSTGGFIKLLRAIHRSMKVKNKISMALSNR